MKTYSERHVVLLELVVIHPINELSLMSELGEIATSADIKRKIELEGETLSSS